jgi:hypothetical protein
MDPVLPLSCGLQQCHAACTVNLLLHGMRAAYTLGCFFDRSRRGVMRFSALTALAFATAVSTGCGEVASSCTRAAMKVGASTQAKVGIGATTKGAALVGREAMQPIARSAGHLGQAAVETEGARGESTPFAHFKRPAIAQTEKSTEDADLTPHTGWTTITEHSSEVGKELLHKGIEKGIEAARDNGRERGQRDEPPKN